MTGLTDAKYRILVVDDNPSITRGLCDIIENNYPGFFEVEAAQNGMEAIEILSSRPIHLVVTDIKMPSVDGLQLLHLIKEQELPCEVVVLSGYDDYSLIRDALKTGAYDYLLKPINIEALVHIIDNLLPLMKEKPGMPSPIDLVEVQNQPGISAPAFFDLVPEEPATREYLEDSLQQAISAALALDDEGAQEHLQIFFRAAGEQVFTESELKRELTNFIYTLMERNQAFIKVVALYKLTEYDIVSIIKNLPTLSQLKNRFCHIISHYIRELEEAGARSNQYTIKRARQYIDAHCHENLTLADLAAELHLHPNYFSNIFKAQTGTTFREYLRNVRIETAKALIANKENKLHDVALQVGYQDASHFNRAFKEVTGVSPSYYRKHLAGEAVGIQ